MPQRLLTPSGIKDQFLRCRFGTSNMILLVWLLGFGELLRASNQRLSAASNYANDATIKLSGRALRTNSVNFTGWMLWTLM